MRGKKLQNEQFENLVLKSTNQLIGFVVFSNIKSISYIYWNSVKN